MNVMARSHLPSKTASERSVGLQMGMQPHGGRGNGSGLSAANMDAYKAALLAGSDDEL